MGLRAALNLIGVAILFGAVVFFVWREWDRSRELASLQGTAVQAQAVGAGTSAGIGALDSGLVQRQRVDVVVSDRRAELVRQTQELKRDDQTVADWAAQPIPERLRDLDRAAGAPVDRLADPASGSGRAVDAAPAGRRDADARRRSDEW